MGNVKLLDGDVDRIMWIELLDSMHSWMVMWMVIGNVPLGKRFYALYGNK